MKHIKYNHNRGFTLVEVIISLVLSVVILAVILQVLIFVLKGNKAFESDLRADLQVKVFSSYLQHDIMPAEGVETGYTPSSFIVKRQDSNGNPIEYTYTISGPIGNQTLTRKEGSGAEKDVLTSLKKIELDYLTSSNSTATSAGDIKQIKFTLTNHSDKIIVTKMAMRNKL